MCFLTDRNCNVEKFSCEVDNNNPCLLNGELDLCNANYTKYPGKHRASYVDCDGTCTEHTCHRGGYFDYVGQQCRG